MRVEELTHLVRALEDQRVGERAARTRAHSDQLAQARLAGEVDALRHRLSEQDRLIERLSNGRPG